MYDAILSTFGSENKLCRVVNCKSGMAALNALVCGQFRSMCSSVWISPQGHRRASLGILLHLPVSIFSLCEPRERLPVVFWDQSVIHFVLPHGRVQIYIGGPSGAMCTRY